MDFKTITESLRAIPQLQQELEDLKLHVAELYLMANAGQLKITIDEAPAEPSFIEQVEGVVATRIQGWKYAYKLDSSGNWAAPLCASAAAEAAGDKNRWREVKAAIKSGEFTRLRWFKMPPPPNWRGGDRDALLIQWVEVIA